MVLMLMSAWSWAVGGARARGPQPRHHAQGTGLQEEGA